MAAKGVNLLPEDDDGQDNDEPEDEYEDSLDELVSSRSRRSRRGGGGFFRAVGIVLAIAILFGGAAWAGYQFWWIPRLEKEQKKVEARKRLENLRKRRIEQAKAERGRRKEELALLQKIRAEAEEKTAESTGQKSEKKKSVEASVKTAQQKDGSKKDASKKATAASKPPVTAIEKAQIRVAKEIPQKKAASKKPAEPLTRQAQVSRVAPRASVKRASPKAPLKEAKKSSGVMMPQAKPAPAVKAKAREAKVVPQKPVTAPRVAKKRGKFYSVQVATCGTTKCVNAFVRRLNKKGFLPIVSRRFFSTATWTEVLLDEFGTKKAALSIAALARKKRVRVTVYQNGKSWRVSAGSFANIEDAAQRLDQVEDAGLKAKLAARPGSRRSGFQAVRTGKLSSRKSAIAMQRRIVQAGFLDSFVVLQK